MEARYQYKELINMHTNVDTLFANMWQDYVAITPSANKIHQLLGRGDDIINDHVAFRTFNHPKVNVAKLAAHLLALGYEEKGDYVFEQKKLKAKHYEHSDPTKPKVFISELLVEEFSDKLQAVVQRIVDQVDEAAVSAENFLYSGTQWKITTAEYEQLLEESEYAAWLAAWGYRPNHFTVSVNYLKGYDSLEAVNQALKDAGFRLNTSGGEIKGGRDVCLAQSSTMADKMPVDFADKTMEIPSCFYEFAERFEMANGELYTGFVAASADKIFESTNAKG